MNTTWIADVPTFNSFNPDSQTNTKIAIDAEFRVHVAFSSTIATAGGGFTLTYGIGTPDGPVQVFGHFPFIAARTYQWKFFEVVSPADWQLTFLFDLALDSSGTAHVCFQGGETNDHQTTGDAKVAVFDEANSDFNISVVQNFTFIKGLSMTIAKNDSVHIAYSDAGGLHYATHAHDADPFVLADVHQQPGTYTDLSIAVGAGGQIGISCMFQPSAGSAAGTLQLLYIQKTASGWIPDTADPGPLNANSWLMTFFNPGTSSLAIDANGVPHIAYFNGSLGLRYGTWSAAGQFFWVVSAFGNGELVDSAALPAPAQILIDPNNVLHIAYQGQTESGTPVLCYATRATAGGWGIQTADPSLNCGFGTSAAMNSKGVPHIAYGFTPIVNGRIEFKHTYGITPSLLIPIHKTPKRPILKRPGM